MRCSLDGALDARERHNPLVLAVPRGGLTVADPIANALGLSLDVWVTGPGPTVRRSGPWAAAVGRVAPVCGGRARVAPEAACRARRGDRGGIVGGGWHGRDREGIDGNSPSGVETLARMCCKSLSIPLLSGQRGAI